MDFKIEEVSEENQKEKKKSNLPIIIVVIISIIIGLGVFFVSNALFGEKPQKEEPLKPQQLSLTDDNVQILYKYVTYGTNNVRGEKFIKEKNVTLDSFTNSEKFYYALQFADVDDFVATGKLNDKKQKIYLISNETIKKYMQRFFGPTVTYTTDSLITYPFDFSINGQNVGIMTYSEENDGFTTVFDGKEEKKEEVKLVEPYYASLVSATKELDGSYKLVEKIIYTKVEKQDDKYSVSIFKDYENTALLEKVSDLTEEQLKTNPISIEKYKNNASTITYNFKVNSGTLYFSDSSITNS